MAESLWFWNIVILSYIAVNSGQYTGQPRWRNYPLTCANESRIPYADRNLDHMNCMCDDKCAIYGDCCFDASYNNSITESKNIFECIQFEGLNDIYIAVRCPSDFTDSEIKEKCKATGVTDEELQNDLSLNIPVTDMTTGVTYANQYCAECNNISKKEKRLTYWIFVSWCYFSFVIKEDGTGYISIEEGPRTSVIRFNGSLFDHCEEKRWLPSVVESSTRLCLRNVITTCTGDLATGNSTKTCGGHMQYIHVNNQLFYNENCAQCSSPISNSDNIIMYCPRFDVPTCYGEDIDNDYESDSSYEKVIKAPTGSINFTKSNTEEGVDNHCDQPISCNNISIFRKWRITSPYGNCYCDERCSLYDDCCPDAQLNVTMQAKIDFKCVKYQSNYHAYMIVSCNNDTWKGTETERKCLSYNEDVYFSPVTDLSSEFTYGNIFCAICNDINTTNRDLVYWVKNMSFEFKPKSYEEKQKYLRFDAASRRWSFEVKRHSYYFSILVPANLIGVVRNCIPIVKTCNDTFEDHLISEKCEEEAGNTYVYKHPHDSPITGMTWWPTAYRNIYCALCNYQADSKLSWCLESGTHYMSGFESVFQPINKNIWTKGISADLETRSLEYNNNVTWLSLREAMTYIGIAVSIAFFVLHFVLFFAVESLNSNFSGKCVSSYSAALLVGYILFCFWDFPTSAFCSFIAVASYYSFTVAFLWMFVMSFDVLRSTRNAMKLISPSNIDKRRRFINYSIFCWLVPLVIVVFSLIIDHGEFDGIPKPMFGKGKICWINGEAFQLYFFIFPCFAMIIVNVIFFVLTSSWIYANRKASPTSSNKEHLPQFKLYGRLALIMGFTWLSAMFAFITNSNVLWILYILLNTTQGPFIFFAFSCKRKVIKSFSNRFPLIHSLPFATSWKVSDNVQL